MGRRSSRARRSGGPAPGHRLCSGRHRLSCREACGASGSGTEPAAAALAGRSFTADVTGEALNGRFSKAILHGVLWVGNILLTCVSPMTMMLSDFLVLVCRPCLLTVGEVRGCEPGCGGLHQGGGGRSPCLGQAAWREAGDAENPGGGRTAAGRLHRKRGRRGLTGWGPNTCLAEPDSSLGVSSFPCLNRSYAPGSAASPFGLYLPFCFLVSPLLSFSS